MRDRGSVSVTRLVRLVEAHPVAASHLAMILGRDPALHVVVSGTNLSSHPAPCDNPSVVIVDLDSLPFEPAAFLHTLKATFINARMLAIGNRFPDDELCRLLFRGTHGFVSYDKIGENLCEAVDALSRGHLWFDAPVLERYAMLSPALRKEKVRGHGILSAREAQVAGLLDRRLSDKEIGCTLGISEHTVRFHLQHIYAKLGVHNRYSAIETMRAGAWRLGGRALKWKDARIALR